MAGSWLSEADPAVRQQLKKLAAATMSDKNTYENSPNPAVAQLWLALASLSARIEKLEKELESKKDKEKLMDAMEGW